VSTDAYLDAKAAFENHDKRVKEFAQFLASVGNAISGQPGKFIFSNTNVGLPMEASMSPDSVSVNANEWRTPQQIQEMLAEWHKLKSEMRSAWDAVPAARRDGLKPPPGMVPHGQRSR
jgi:hypothetical protein